MKFLTTLTRTMNSCKIDSVARLEGRASVAVEFLSRWPAVSAATSVSYKAYLSRKASIARRSQSFFARRSQSFWKHCFTINCIRHAIFNHYKMMIMSWNCQVLVKHMRNVRRILCHNCSAHVSRNSVFTSPIESRSLQC